jgi:hypothetical protein
VWADGKQQQAGDNVWGWLVRGFREGIAQELLHGCEYLQCVSEADGRRQQVGGASGTCAACSAQIISHCDI